MAALSSTSKARLNFIAFFASNIYVLPRQASPDLQTEMFTTHVVIFIFRRKPWHWRGYIGTSCLFTNGKHALTTELQTRLQSTKRANKLPRVFVTYAARKDVVFKRAITNRSTGSYIRSLCRPTSRLCSTCQANCLFPLGLTGAVAPRGSNLPPPKTPRRPWGEI
jgi:hypothetical protein